MRRYLEVFSLCLLASCTVGPNYQRPQFYSDQAVKKSLNQENKTAPQKVSLVWFRQFNDETLNRLVLEGLNQSPTVETATQKLHQARQSLKINAVQNMPKFDLDGSYHRVSDSVTYGPPITTDYYQTGIDASWELDIWGGGRRLTENSIALLKAASSNLDNVKLTLTAEITNNYVNLRRSQEQLRISKHNLKLQQDIYELVKAKYEAGLADDIAYNQSKYIVETTKMLIPTLEYQGEAYKNALTILVGQLPGEMQSELDNTHDNIIQRPVNYDLDKLYNLPVNVIRNRPDVQISELNLIAQNAKIGQAIAQLFPNASLSGFLGYQSKNLGALVGANHDMYSIAPAITLPIFHFGELVSNVELQQAATKEQLAVYQNSILNAAAEIRNAMVNLQKEYQRNQSSREAVSSQKIAADLTVEKYKQGLIDFNDVLTTQQDLLNSQNTLAASNAAIYEDIISFYKAIGGGYSPQNSLHLLSAQAKCCGDDGSSQAENNCIKCGK